MKKTSSRGQKIVPSPLLQLNEKRPYDRLRSIAELLNDRPSYMSVEDHAKLVRLVEVWQSAGPGFDQRKWQQAGFSVDAIAGHMNHAVSGIIVLRGQFNGQAMLMLEKRLPLQHAKIDSQGVLTLETKLPLQHVEGDGYFYWFATLAVEDKAALMWGGHCDGCGKFYVKNSLRQKRFCKANCMRPDTSAERKRHQRASNLTIRIEQANRLVDEWEGKSEPGKRKCKGGWKKFVASKMFGEPVTAGWVTRHVNKGQIREPARLT